jgi:hypothetical protein
MVFSGGVDWVYGGMLDPCEAVEFLTLSQSFNSGMLTLRGVGTRRDSIKRVPKPECVRELVEEPQGMSPKFHSNWERVNVR